MSNITAPAVCEHLQPFLSHFLAQNGTKVDAVVTAWTAVKFVVNLNKGPSLKELSILPMAKHAPSFVEIGENVDQHYPLQVEIVCKKCKEGIAWPTPKQA
jgi:hypothetical protein